MRRKLPARFIGVPIEVIHDRPPALEKRPGPPDGFVTTLTLDEIKRRREYNYRRTPERRVCTIEEARAFVEEVGFCHFWPIKGFETHPKES